MVVVVVVSAGFGYCSYFTIRATADYSQHFGMHSTFAQQIHVTEKTTGQENLCNSSPKVSVVIR